MSSLSTRSMVIGLIIGLVIGAGAGSIASPGGTDLSDLEQQIASLQTQMSRKDNEINTLRTQISGNNAEIANMQSQISEKDSEIKQLELLRDQAHAEIEALQNDIVLKDDLICSLEEKIPISEKEGWIEIKRFSGSSIKNTEPFYINSDIWRITYNFTFGKEHDFGVLNVIAVNVSNGMPVAQIVSQEINKIESSYVYYGNSNFYLGISGYNVIYDIIIEAFNDV